MVWCRMGSIKRRKSNKAHHVCHDNAEILQLMEVVVVIKLTEVMGFFSVECGDRQAGG